MNTKLISVGNFLIIGLMAYLFIFAVDFMLRRFGLGKFQVI